MQVSSTPFAQEAAGACIDQPCIGGAGTGLQRTFGIRAGGGVLAGGRRCVVALGVDAQLGRKLSQFCQRVALSVAAEPLPFLVFLPAGWRGGDGVSTWEPVTPGPPGVQASQSPSKPVRVPARLPNKGSTARHAVVLARAHARRRNKPSRTEQAVPRRAHLAALFPLAEEVGVRDTDLLGRRHHGGRRPRAAAGAGQGAGVPRFPALLAVGIVVAGARVAAALPPPPVGRGAVRGLMAQAEGVCLHAHASGLLPGLLPRCGGRGIVLGMCRRPSRHPVPHAALQVGHRAPRGAAGLLLLGRPQSFPHAVVCDAGTALIPSRLVLLPCPSCNRRPSPVQRRRKKKLLIRGPPPLCPLPCSDARQ